MKSWIAKAAAAHSAPTHKDVPSEVSNVNWVIDGSKIVSDNSNGPGHHLPAVVDVDAIMGTADAAVLAVKLLQSLGLKTSLQSEKNIAEQKIIGYLALEGSYAHDSLLEGKLLTVQNAADNQAGGSPIFHGLPKMIVDGSDEALVEAGRLLRSCHILIEKMDVMYDADDQPRMQVVLRLFGQNSGISKHAIHKMGLLAGALSGVKS